MNPLLATLLGAIVPGGNLVQLGVTVGLKLLADLLPEHAEVITKAQVVTTTNSIVCKGIDVANAVVAQDYRATITTVAALVRPLLSPEHQTELDEVLALITALEPVIDKLLALHAVQPVAPAPVESQPEVPQAPLAGSSGGDAQF